MNFLRYFFLLLLSLAIYPGSLLASPEQPRIEAIGYQKSGSVELVTFTLNVPNSPTVFTLTGDNPRIVFDFAKTTISRKVTSVYSADGDIIERIRVGLHKGANPKTRVVLDLATNNEVSVDQTFNQKTSVLTVSLKSIEDQNALREPHEESAKTASPPPAEEVVDTVASPSAPENASVVPPASTPEPELQAESVPKPRPDLQEQPVSLGNTTSLADEKPLLRSIIFDDATDNGEMVIFQLNGFYPPTVKGIEEEKPRAICDFKNTAIAPEVTSIEETGGKFVKSIRIGKHTDPELIRVVIDLKPSKNYDLQQVFFKEDNLFVIIVNTQEAQKTEKVNN
ncbi:AMIN domain-containing protein [Desulfogranum japonicum]|uniref:AMIN domain-containing protein n=1 Tax=Desulfogranum japonicum TaxID=231447 RepID=UPI0013766C31|nr:AMIN domain-containing protein [Desulfogranum japonicum]